MQYVRSDIDHQRSPRTPAPLHVREFHGAVVAVRVIRAVDVRQYVTERRVVYVIISVRCRDSVTGARL